MTTTEFSRGKLTIGIIERDNGDWRVCFSSTPHKSISFGPALYGGKKEEAENDAKRVADKWDFKYIGEVSQ